MGRRTLLLGTVAAGVAVAIATAAARARRTGSSGNEPVAHRARRERSTEVARLGTRVGVDYALHRARRTFADAARRDELDRAFELATAADIAASLGNMKGALMKLGQMASYLDDGLPEPLRDALATLQQDAPPMSAELAAGVVAEELGAPPSDVFETWDEVPIAAASIGQVHRAMTRDGRAVAVKVQYPGVDEAIAADLSNTDLLVNAMGMLHPGMEPGPIVEEIRERLTEELDYRQEADNVRLFANFYRDHPFIHVPDVVDELSAQRVITTELATGARFADVLTWSAEERSLAAETIYRFVFRSVYRLHAFNGDPHPGNYLFNPAGKVTFLDFGLVKRFTPEEVRLFEDMALRIAIEHDGDAYRRVLEDANVLKPWSGLTEAEVLDYFGQFYLPVLEDEPFTFSHEFARDTVQRFMFSDGKVGKFGNVPGSMVILQRINLGLYSILADLEATANWRRISEELWPMTDTAPSTPLGELEREWMERRAVNAS
ncbi:MAG TPA: AarF/ABC1/UbiB kinase family protein [Acidimicrobiales bacterium]